MKLYDKAYTEAISKKETDYYMDKMGDNFPLKEHTDVIMLSIEELKELWNAGCKRGWEETRPTEEEEASDFETYLQSKGLTIKQQ